MAKKPSAPAYLSLSPNDRGRDFVINRIDRTFNITKDSVNFDEAKDRMICVSDLISTEARPNLVLCDLLDKKWFFFTKGANTAALLDIASDYETYNCEKAEEQGLRWVVREAQACSLWLGEMIPKLRRGPTIIDMQTPEGLLGFSSGMVPPTKTWVDCVEKAKSQDKAFLRAISYCGHDLTQRDVAGVDKIFTGYSALEAKTQLNGNIVSVGKICEVSAMLNVVPIRSKSEPVETTPEIPAKIYQQPLPLQRNAIA